MKILFVGPDSGTSSHRFRAFRRMGHDVELVDPRSYLPRSPLIERIEWKIHPAPLAAWVRPRVVRALRDRRFDLAFVDGGSLVGAGLVRDLKARCSRVVCFNHDDPFGPRDGVRFAALRTAVPLYDLIVVVREPNIAEAKALGATRVLHSFRVADEVEHAPRPLTPEIVRTWSSQIAFVGTWMPERGPFLARLVALGLPVSIFGSGWQKAREWPVLRSGYRTGHLEGDEYCYAVQCAEICIGLLSEGNRDLHTTRSMEIPALGSLFCAQRTPEHLQLYVDGQEAVFWNGPDDCADHCRTLLQAPERRKRIADAGRVRCLANGHFTEKLLGRVLYAAAA
jgi:hypothetical protein